MHEKTLIGLREEGWGVVRNKYIIQKTIVDPSFNIGTIGSQETAISAGS